MVKCENYIESVRLVTTQLYILGVVFKKHLKLYIKIKHQRFYGCSREHLPIFRKSTLTIDKITNVEIVYYSILFRYSLEYEIYNINRAQRIQRICVLLLTKDVERTDKIFKKYSQPYSNQKLGLQTNWSLAIPFIPIFLSYFND